MLTVVFAGRVAGMVNGIVETLTAVGPELQMVVPPNVALRSASFLLPVLLPLSSFHVTEPDPVVNG